MLYFRGKRGDSHLILTIVFSIVLALAFAMVAVAVFTNSNGYESARAEYFVKDVAYMTNLLIASPNPVWLKYTFELDNYLLEDDGGIITIVDKTHNSRLAEMTTKRQPYGGSKYTKLDIFALNKKNYFVRSNKILFSSDQVKSIYLCPNIDTVVEAPTVYFNPLLSEHEDLLFSFVEAFETPSFRLNLGPIVITRVKGDFLPDDFIFDGDLMLSLSMIEDDEDYILFRGNDKKSMKLACMIGNKLFDEFDYDSIILGEGGSETELLIEFHSKELSLKKGLLYENRNKIHLSMREVILEYFEE